MPIFQLHQCYSVTEHASTSFCAMFTCLYRAALFFFFKAYMTFRYSNCKRINTPVDWNNQISNPGRRNKIKTFNCGKVTVHHLQTKKQLHFTESEFQFEVLHSTFPLKSSQRKKRFDQDRGSRCAMRRRVSRAVRGATIPPPAGKANCTLQTIKKVTYHTKRNTITSWYNQS